MTKLKGGNIGKASFVKDSRVIGKKGELPGKTKIKTEHTILDRIKCGTCNTLFALPRESSAWLMKTGALFFCPSGHSLVFLESDSLNPIILNEKIRGLKAVSRGISSQKEQLVRQIELRDKTIKTTERSRNAYKGLYRKEKSYREGT